ncbi:UNVERIFIED_CONTAM: hypothetical protein H355_012848 [Colinus virginianus]|nr:hypothetical protein H355_012848 [Colinus virginianus]
MEEKPSAGIRPHLDKLTLGVTRILGEHSAVAGRGSETSPGVSDVTLVEKEPADRHAIISWEQKNSCILPEDLKNFYLMTDGFQMTWSVKIDDTPMPLGSMVINSISQLSRLGGSSMYTVPNAPSLADLEDDTDEEGNEDKPEKPHFDSRSLIFELDPCNGNGKVCLVYKHTKPVVSSDTEIWFLDRALYWHFLTKTFTAYYRLLITHLGLPQWQYAFTSYGVSPQAKISFLGIAPNKILRHSTKQDPTDALVEREFQQWFNMYKPITINTTLLSEEADSFVNKLDPNKVFKSKNKTPVMKKKQPSQPTSVQKSNTSMPSTKTSSLAGNSSRK